MSSNGSFNSTNPVKNHDENVKDASDLMRELVITGYKPANENEWKLLGGPNCFGDDTAQDEYIADFLIPKLNKLLDSKKAVVKGKKSKRKSKRKSNRKSKRKTK